MSSAGIPRGDERALVLGKFLPPHLGHVHLVDNARANHAHVTVLVCSIASEPIPGALRHAWMSELFPTLDVVHVDDELPQAPEESAGFWPLWTTVIAREAGRVDVVYTSEDYGDELARRLGARHVLVDRDRATVPVSGTAVRADPMRNWNFLPAPVRAFYCRRIALVGPESVGKSTLAHQLADALGTVMVAEYGREHTEAMALPAELTLQDIEVIASVQREREDAAAREANRVLVCDTDALVTASWSEVYFGSVPDTVRAMANESRYALHLLLDVDLPWTDDGTRHHRHERERHHAWLQQALEARGWPWELVRGSGAARLASALDAIRRRCPELAPWMPAT